MSDKNIDLRTGIELINLANEQIEDIAERLSEIQGPVTLSTLVGRLRQAHAIMGRGVGLVQTNCSTKGEPLSPELLERRGVTPNHVVILSAIITAQDTGDNKSGASIGELEKLSGITSVEFAVKSLIRRGFVEHIHGTGWPKRFRATEKGIEFHRRHSSGRMRHNNGLKLTAPLE